MLITVEIGKYLMNGYSVVKAKMKVMILKLWDGQLKKLVLTEDGHGMMWLRCLTSSPDTYNQLKMRGSILV